MNCLNVFLSLCQHKEPTPSEQFETALLKNRLEAAFALITDGQDVNAATQTSGLTPLELAVATEDLRMIRMLLEKRADIERRCPDGWTPVISACAMGFLEGVELLSECGADLSVCSSSGLTCLLVAASNGHHSVVSFLLQQRTCDLNAVGRAGFTPLHYLAVLNDAENIAELIRGGANINAQNTDCEVAVYLATKHNCLKSLEVLLQFGADPNIITADGNCALREAVVQSNIEAVRLLLENGAYLTKTHDSGSREVQQSDAASSAVHVRVEDEEIRAGRRTGAATTTRNEAETSLLSDYK